MDHLGSPRQITDGGAVETAFHTYYPFGSEATDPEQSEGHLRFTGHERDENGSAGTGALDYMHARYCSSGLGRFLSPDPLESGKAENPQTWNSYAYGLSNPIRLVDPNGMTVASALRLIQSNREHIQAASQSVEGKVSPLEIARVVFQENRNDLNKIRDSDISAILPLPGGPEVKNAGAQVLFLFGRHGSFGIGEMRTDTAAKHLRFGTELNGLERGIIQKRLNNPPDALKLVARELARIRTKFPQASTAQMLNAYNRGDELIFNMGAVAQRSGKYLARISLALDGELSGFQLYFSALLDDDD
ncbi:MAG: RHS repeat-associated core domain-containing protein [bacterium]|nr:RHS repeat-associated core domain-containing protein [bacterium]